MPFKMNTRSSNHNLNTRQIRTTIDPKYAIVAFRETLTCAIYNIQNVDKPKKKVSGATIKVEVNDGLRKGTIVSTTDQFDKLLPILHKFDVSSFFGVIKRKIRDESNPTSTNGRKTLKRPDEPNPTSSNGRKTLKRPYEPNPTSSNGRKILKGSDEPNPTSSNGRKTLKRPTSTNERKTLKRPTEIQIPRSPTQQRLYGYRRTHRKNSKCRRCLFCRDTDTSFTLALRIPVTPKSSPTLRDTAVFDVDLPADSPLFECLSPMSPPSPCAALHLAEPQCYQDEPDILPTSEDTSTEPITPITTSNAVYDLLCRTTNDAPNYSSVIKGTDTQHHSDTFLETIHNAHLVLSGCSPENNFCNYPIPTSSSSELVHNPRPVTRLNDHPTSSSISYNTSESTDINLLPILPPTNNTSHVQSTVNHPLPTYRDIVDIPTPMTTWHAVTNHLSPTTTKPHTSRPCAKPIASIINNHSRPSPTSATVNYPSNGTSNGLPSTTSSEISNRLPPTSKDIVDTLPLASSVNSSTVYLTATTTERHNPLLQASTTVGNLVPVSPFNVNHVPSTTTNLHSYTPQAASDIVQYPQPVLSDTNHKTHPSIKRPRIHISDDETEPLSKRAKPYITKQRTSNLSPWSSNCSRMYGYKHETLLALIEPVHDIDNEAFLQEISSLEYPSPNKDVSHSYADEGEDDTELSERLSPIVEPLSSLEYPSPNKDMSCSYADEGEEDMDLSERLSPIVKPPLTNAGSKNTVFQVTGQETQYHSNHTFILPPAPWRQLQPTIHNVNRYQSFTTSLTKTIPQKNQAYTPIEIVLPPVYVSSSRASSIQNSYPGALPDHTNSNINQTDLVSYPSIIPAQVSFPSIIPAQVPYRQTYSQNLLSTSNPIPTIAQSTISRVCPQPLPHSSNVVPVKSQLTVYRCSQVLESAKYPFEQAQHQYPNGTVSNETTFEPDPSTSTSVHTQKGKNRRNESRARSKPQFIITDPRIMKLKACELVGRRITINRIQQLINQLPEEEDVIEDTTKPYVIPVELLRQVIQISNGCPEIFSRKLLCRIFTLEELQGRSVKSSGRLKKNTYVDSRKMEAIQNAVFTWFPGSVYIWNFCVHRMNVHIRYINQKLKNIYNPQCVSLSN